MVSSGGRSSWLMLAIASGACAACNGVFAKLTTTELTTSWSSFLVTVLGINSSNKLVEYAIRGLFFALNLVFNGIMWGLFTRALTLGSSTVRVSIINTSANFVVTAILGALVFGEKLPGLWWLGAAMLVTGSVIIGRREATTEKNAEPGTKDKPRLERDGVADVGKQDDVKVELRGVRNRGTYNAAEHRESK